MTMSYFLPGERISLLERLRNKKISPSAMLSVGLVPIAILLGAATYGILTGLAPFQLNYGIVIILLLANLAVVSILVGLIATRVFRLMRARRSGLAGAKLHSRLITLFSVIAVIPALLVGLFAFLTLHQELESWFSKRNRTIIENSLLIAQSYLNEHAYVLRADVYAMLGDLNRSARQLYASRADFERFLTTQSALRSLGDVYVIERGIGQTDGTDFASVEGAPLPQPAPIQAVWAAALPHGNTGSVGVPPEDAPPTDAMYDAADERDVILIRDDENNRVRALASLASLPGFYLHAARFVDPRVLEHLAGAARARAEYDNLEGRRFEVEFTFALVYIAMTLIVVLAAIWLGLWLANRIMTPIGALAYAAEQVSKGDLSARVNVEAGDDEISLLGRTFNRMTGQVQSQRDELVRANMEMDARRRFTEAVLSGVSAGVIGLDVEGRVNHINKSARHLLGATGQPLLGEPISKVMPKMAPLVRLVMERRGGEGRGAPPQPLRTEGEITLDDGVAPRILLARVAAERGGGDMGYVITFDDITELVTAQRRAAWSDIARRIAHEIKNPLTPIQLAAERLWSKFHEEVRSDKHLYKQYTDTIIRHVGDIGRMVDEFSSFARMPAPRIQELDPGELTRQTVFLQQQARQDIDYRMEIPEQPVRFHGDRGLLRQALGNLLKNAQEAVDAKFRDGGGAIRTRLRIHEDGIVIEVADNGPGLPPGDPETLMQPYYTTREKGSGLGLAIVRKIAQDHGGALVLAPADGADGLDGACASLHLPFDGAGMESGEETERPA